MIFSAIDVTRLFASLLHCRRTLRGTLGRETTERGVSDGETKSRAIIITLLLGIQLVQY